MKRHPPKTIAIIVIALLTQIILPGCQRDTEQSKVRKIIIDVQRAAEEKDIRTVLGHLSRIYRDSQGYDYNGIRDLLLSYFFRHQRISVYLMNLDVTVDADSARATFQAVLSAGVKTGSATNVLPEALGIYSFDVKFSKESKQWRVVSSTWERLGDLPPGKPR